MLHAKLNLPSLHAYRSRPTGRPHLLDTAVIMVLMKTTIQNISKNWYSVNPHFHIERTKSMPGAVPINVLCTILGVQHALDDAKQHIIRLYICSVPNRAGLEQHGTQKQPRPRMPVRMKRHAETLTQSPNAVQATTHNGVHGSTTSVTHAC